MAKTIGQLGLLAERAGTPVEALEQMVRCAALFDEFPHPSTEPAPGHLARLTRQLGMKALEDAWVRATGRALPQAVRDYVGSRQQQGG
jgi:hypothetical protein